MSRRPPSARDPQRALIGRTMPAVNRLVQGHLGSRAAAPLPRPLPNRQSRAATPTGAGLRPASVVVAAVDSTAACKAGADVICTGTSDQDPIQTAYDAVGAAASILLLPGTYAFDSSLSLEAPGSSITGPGATVSLTGFRTGIELNADYCVVEDVNVFVPYVAGVYNVQAVQLSGVGCRASLVRVIGEVAADTSLNFAILAESEDCVITACHVEGAYNAFTLEADRCILTGSTGKGNVVGSQVFGGKDCVVSGNTLLGGTINGNMGDGVYVDGPNGFRANISGNTIVSHYMGINVNALAVVVSNNTVILSQVEGIGCYGGDSKVTDNFVAGSGQSASATFSNIQVAGSGIHINQMVTGNTCRAQATNKTGAAVGSSSAQYGLDITGTAAFVSHNDLLNGGITAAYSDTGTGTVIAAANRT